MVDNNTQGEDTYVLPRREYLLEGIGGSAAVVGLGSPALDDDADAGDIETSERICFTPTTVLAQRIRDGDLSPVEVVETFLARIEERDDDLNAFLTLMPDHAREAAKEAERAVERGDDLGPLHGIPFAIKDRQKLEDVRFTDGFLAFEDQIAEETDPEVQAFLDAGAIPIGKTNTPEGGYMGKTDNLIVGPTSTPFDLDEDGDLERNSGGSSGGSATAVADGLLPFATGTDGAGSIRIPASFTGTYGLFPRIDDPGEFGTGDTYFQPSVSTRTVADTALTMSVMQEDDENATEYRAALEDDVDGLSIAYDPNLGIYPLDDRVRAVVDEGVETITEEGATVEPVEVDLGQSYDEFMEAVWIVWTTSYAELAETFAEEEGVDALGEERDLFPDALVEIIETGQTYLDDDGELLDEPLTTTIEARSRAYAGIQAVLGEYDLLATSTLSVPPVPNDELGPAEIDDGVEWTQDLDGNAINPIIGWLITTVCNMTGHPAASVPAGLTDQGAPVGMQLVGPSHDDRTIVAASAAYERVNSWHDAYPGR